MMSRTHALSVDQLAVTYGPSGLSLKRGSSVDAVRYVSFDVPTGTCAGLVGESGSGKSTIAQVVLGLLRPRSGQVHLDGELVVDGPEKPNKELIERRVQAVFQDPLGSLNPRMSSWELVSEGWHYHPEVRPADVRSAACEALERVGIGKALWDRRPTSLSGGQCQRVAIARALVLNPRLLVCDEPTSALDVSIQAQIINLLRDLQADEMSMLFISHDLAVVRQVAQTVIVLKDGEIVEQGPVEAVFDAPEAPYTRDLLAAAEGRRVVHEESS